MLMLPHTTAGASSPSGSPKSAGRLRESAAASWAVPLLILVVGVPGARRRPRHPGSPSRSPPRPGWSSSRSALRSSHVGYDSACWAPCQLLGVSCGAPRGTCGFARALSTYCFAALLTAIGAAGSSSTERLGHRPRDPPRHLLRGGSSSCRSATAAGSCSSRPSRVRTHAVRGAGMSLLKFLSTALCLVRLSSGAVREPSGRAWRPCSGSDRSSPSRPGARLVTHVPEDLLRKLFGALLFAVAAQLGRANVAQSAALTLSCRDPPRLLRSSSLPSASRRSRPRRRHLSKSAATDASAVNPPHHDLRSGRRRALFALLARLDLTDVQSFVLSRPMGRAVLYGCWRAALFAATGARPDLGSLQWPADGRLPLERLEIVALKVLASATAGASARSAEGATTLFDGAGSSCASAAASRPPPVMSVSLEDWGTMNVLSGSTGSRKVGPPSRAGVDDRAADHAEARRTAAFPRAARSSSQASRRPRVPQSCRRPRSRCPHNGVQRPHPVTTPKPTPRAPEPNVGG